MGFSYSHLKADLTTGDNQTAADNYAALNAFFAKFPDFTAAPFYVSGESYGGVCVGPNPRPCPNPACRRVPFMRGGLFWPFWRAPTPAPMHASTHRSASRVKRACSPATPHRLDRLAPFAQT